MIRLAARSLWARRVTALLTILSIATAVLLFTAVENIRQGARLSFERTITDTDLIVGARSSPINLVLYSVFQIGDPTNNVTWQT
ncbi:MAG: ABC transporter permease, partial [Pseudomonadota bacterium]